MRILNTTLAALLTASLSVAYGFKEQTRALEREIAAESQRAETLEREIALLEFEWRDASSPERLTELSGALFGVGAAMGAEGAPLSPWRPDQIVTLAPASPTPPPRQSRPVAEIATATVRGSAQAGADAGGAE